MTQKKSQKRNVSGWLVLNKPLERRQRKCAAVARFGVATAKKSYGGIA